MRFPFGGTYDATNATCNVWCHFSNAAGTVSMPAPTGPTTRATTSNATRATPSLLSSRGRAIRTRAFPASSPSVLRCHAFGPTTHVNGVVDFVSRERHLVRRVLWRRAIALSLGLSPSRACRSVSAARRLGRLLAVAAIPVGLIILQGDGQGEPWVDAEGLAWAGSTNRNGNYDVLTALVRLHDPRNFVSCASGDRCSRWARCAPCTSTGPTCVSDRRWARASRPSAGCPVEPQFGYKAYDWLAGGRVAQSIGPATSLGVSYLQQREDGQLSYEDAGIDFARRPCSLVRSRGARHV